MAGADIVRLKDARRLAKGSERAIYALPGAPDQLIKVMLPKYRRALDGVDPDTAKGRRRHAVAYALFFREEDAIARARAMAQARGIRSPLPDFLGYRDTDMGLGQVVEMIRDDAGAMAPSLADQCAEGSLSASQQSALDAFVAAIYDLHIVVHDAGPKNIVWDAAAARYVLVDGFGDRSALPLKTWFKPLNDRRLDRAFAECAQKAGLLWDAGARRLA
ncbi:PhoP regulatory network protein YrbL [Roseivivax lentus]|uniref:PhoP regulatory network protein YrbL n=1 Tax=Roseivivax lentus TaxID=633194 RepID=A0A1N7MQJ8_9RHOB|nr:YrbL family protein [Roseivivax lentus]SIS88231.1 PhoP regulatory network protein YrbL [Roseivivax lentus]